MTGELHGEEALGSEKQVLVMRLHGPPNIRLKTETN